MASSAAASSEKVVLNFAWTGPNTWHGGSSQGGLDIRVVDLVFKDAKTEVSVHLPEKISPAAPKKFSFTCWRPSGETHPAALSVTTEQVRNLTLKAGVFEKGRPIGPKTMDSSGRITQQETVRRSDRVIGLTIPDDLIPGQTYKLVVSSDIHLALSARLEKEETSPAVEDTSTDTDDEFRRRAGRMGAKLIDEGMRNLSIASNGEAGTFGPSTSTADIAAHGIRGIIQAGQEMDPEIRVPDTKPSESASDLDLLSIEELQTRLEKALILDKGLSTRRLKASLAGNVPERNNTLDAEFANMQLIINLSEALERKGVKAEMPKSESYMTAAAESAELHTDALKDLEGRCHPQ